MQKTADAHRVAFTGRRWLAQTLLVMKLTMVLLIGGLLQVHAKGISQQVTLSGKDIAVQTVFSAVEKQTGYSVVGNRSILRNAKRVSIDAVNMDLEHFLDIALRDQPFKYEISDKTIILSKRVPAADLSPRLNLDPPPPITVRGRVVNEKGEPVIASVLVKATNAGLTTDNDGYFVLENIDEKSELIISGIGIETQTVAVNGKSTLQIRAITKITSENEVIISNGYVSSSKRLSTMNISRVNGDEINNQPVTSLMNAVAGRIPGLDLSASSGDAGSAVQLQIRGGSSLRSSGNYPLFVIDGVQIESNPVQSFNAQQLPLGIDPLSNLNPANIESIEVLKDASATAIYGSRGANGVIRITTKRAKLREQGTDFDINFYTGAAKVSRKLDLLNREQYLAMRHEAFANSGLVPDEFSSPDLTGVWDTTRSTDWQKELIGGSAGIVDMQAAVSGGNSNTSYRVTGGYHKENTVYPGDLNYQRASGTFSINHISLNQKFTANVSTIFGAVKNNMISSNLFVESALSLPPVAPKIYNDDGSLNWQIYPFFGGTFEYHSWNNPMAQLKRTFTGNSSDMISSATFGYEFIPGLTGKTLVSFSRYQSDDIVKSPIAATAPFFVPFTQASASFSNNSRSSFMVEPQITYNKKAGDHQINIMVGGSWQQRKTIYQAIEATGYTSDVLLNSKNGAALLTSREDNDIRYKYAAFIFHAGYNYRGKYLLDINGRRDGSSRFGPGKKYGTFASIGAGWIFSEENAIRNNLAFLSYGKLRSSYGTTGNDQIGDYMYLNTYSILNPGYLSGTNLVPFSLFNSDFAWETTKKLEIAIELGFLNNRINFDASWYRNRSSNQLVGYALPATTGFQSILDNFDATLDNAGWEFNLSSLNISSKNFKWRTTINYSIPRNKLVRFENLESSAYSTIYKIGSPLTTAYSYVFKGVNPETGRFEVEDLNNDGEITPDDKTFTKAIGKIKYGGILNSFNIYNFELSFLFQYVHERQLGNLPAAAPGGFRNQLTTVLDRWQKPGDIAPYQLFLADPGNYVAFESDGYHADASYLRLKTLSLSYRFPMSLQQRLKLKDASVFIQGQNLLTFSDYRSFDPETGPTSLPPLRMLTLGVQVKL